MVQPVLNSYDDATKKRLYSFRPHFMSKTIALKSQICINCRTMDRIMMTWCIFGFTVSAFIMLIYWFRYQIILYWGCYHVIQSFWHYGHVIIIKWRQEISWWYDMRVARAYHDDVIEWKHFPRYWPFVYGIHRSLVNSPHKDQWRGAWIFSLICAWTNVWVINRDANDLRRHRAHCDVTVMHIFSFLCTHGPIISGRIYY